MSYLSNPRSISEFSARFTSFLRFLPPVLASEKPTNKETTSKQAANCPRNGESQKALKKLLESGKSQEHSPQQPAKARKIHLGVHRVFFRPQQPVRCRSHIGQRRLRQWLTLGEPGFVAAGWFGGGGGLGGKCFHLRFFFLRSCRIR